MTAFLPLAELYDIAWIHQKHTEYANDKNEGGMMQLVLILVWFLFFFKILLFLIMWKATLNFPKFVKQQRELVGLR